MSRLSTKASVIYNWNPGSIADGDEIAANVTVPGVEFGDFVFVSPDTDLTDLQLTATVVGAGFVALVLSNSTNGAIDLGATNFRVAVVDKEVMMGAGS